MLTVAGPKLVVVEPAVSPATVLVELARPGQAPPVLDRPDDRERVVAVVFTSGTTGTPKGAVSTNRQLAAVTAADLRGRGDPRYGWGEPPRDAKT